MKKVLIPALAALLATSFAVTAEAAGKQRVSADVRAACKQEAAKKFSAIHFIKRNKFTNDCIAQHAGRNKMATTKRQALPSKQAPTTSGQSSGMGQPSGTGQPSSMGEPPKQK